MTARTSGMLLVLVALFGAFAPRRSDAQVLVYQIDFSKDKGINYQPFEGGFFVAPLLGGTGDFLLTSTDGGRTYTEVSGGGRLFTAVSGDDKKAVMSAKTGAGTAEGAMVAMGDIKRKLSVHSPTVDLQVLVAELLTGTAISADDESEAEEPAADGSIGSAGMSAIRLTLDETQTNSANKKGLSIGQTVEQLKAELGRHGFAPVETTTDDSTGTTPDTTTGTGTGS